MSAAEALDARRFRDALRGRTFLAPWLDYGLIGGGLSLLAVAALWFQPAWVSIEPRLLAFLLLTCNIAHFASSTVRLYTIPRAFARWPLLTTGFPLVALGALFAGLAWADTLGLGLMKLYLTWSPYHYAAQAYGLALMYAYRSGCRLDATDKRAFRIVSLVPFLWIFFLSPDLGLGWIAQPLVPTAFGPVWTAASQGFTVAAFAAPLALQVFVTRRRGVAPPLICPLLMLSNAAWWFLLPPLQAFLWATIFHGIQYLAIVTLFHVEDRMAVPGNHGSRAGHALRFYAASLVLGYVLFQLLPRGTQELGFGAADSALLVVAVINLHHFIVDGFIWRLGSGGRNRAIVESGSA